MKRIQVIDGLRGFALLGILLVNIQFFNESLQAISLGGDSLQVGLNRIVDLLLSIFVEGKFMLLFSFLFGYGAVILFNNTLEKNTRFTPLFMKRMSALLFFGILHGIYIWYGDILTSYALVGLLLLPFMKRRPKTLLISSIISMLLIPLLMTLPLLASTSYGIVPYTDAEVSEAIQQSQEHDRQIYGSGTMAEIQQQRINDYLSSFFNMILFFPQILGTFLLGAYFAKLKLLENTNKQKPFYIKLVLIGGPLGICLQLPKLFSASQNMIFEVLSAFIAGPLLMLAYVSLFALAFHRYNRQLRFFSDIGRMGFSMYILQSVICSLIFYSYGLGLFGELELWQTTLMAFFIYGFQVLLSSVWLRRFRTGPLEYIWRLLYRGKVA